LWVDEDELTSRKTCRNMWGDHARARTDVEHARSRLQAETLDQTIGAEQLSSKRMLEEKSKSSWTALWSQKHVSMMASKQNRRGEANASEARPAELQNCKRDR
jgi:hypothetical protein